MKRNKFIKLLTVSPLGFLLGNNKTKEVEEYKSDFVEDKEGWENTGEYTGLKSSNIVICIKAKTDLQMMVFGELFTAKADSYTVLLVPESNLECGEIQPISGEGFVTMQFKDREELIWM